MKTEQSTQKVLWQQESFPFKYSIQEFVFNVINKGSCYCLWPTESCCNNPGDNIYFWNSDDKNSGGFGGREIIFETTEGMLKTRGPWHSNSKMLLHNTGVDLTRHHYTKGLLAKRRDCDDKFRNVYSELVFQDENWVIGSFDRVKERAKILANRKQIKLYYAVQSAGGSSQGMVEP